MLVFQKIYRSFFSCNPGWDSLLPYYQYAVLIPSLVLNLQGGIDT